MHDCVVLVVAGAQRVVELLAHLRLVGLAGQEPQSARGHRHGEGDGIVLLAARQRLVVRREQLVRHDRRGSEHLGAADGDAGVVLVDHGGDEVTALLLASGLRAVGLRVLDDVADEQVALAGVVVEVAVCGGAGGAVPLEHLDADHHAAERRGEVVGRAAEHAEVLAGPGLERPPPITPPIPHPSGAGARRAKGTGERGCPVLGQTGENCRQTPALARGS